MSNLTSETSRAMKAVFIKTKVMCEPELEELVSGMRPADRRILCVKLKRWTHQLEVTATVLEKQSLSFPQPKRLKKISPSVAVKN
jgi:hypothetical protein